MQRIVLLSNGLARGGAENQLVHLAEALVATGREVAVVSILPSTAHADRVAKAGVPVYVTGGERPRPLRTLVRTVRLLRRLRPDALITFIYQANVLGIVAGRAARVPVIVTSLRNSRFGSRRRELLLAAVGRLGTVTVPNSELAATALRRRWIVPRTGVHVVPNLLDIGPFRAARARREALRRSFGWSDDDVVWACVARLEPQKGHATLLDAFARVLAQAPTARLVLVGAGSAETAIRRQAAPLGDRVTILGDRDDVPDLLAAADGLVLASRYEGLPNCVLEAMAAELPVVATAVGGVPELVVDGATGVLVRPGDVDALTDALVELTLHRDAREAMAQRAVAALARYDPRSVTEAWTEVVDAALATRNHRPQPRPRLAAPTAAPVTFFLPSFAGGGAQRSVLALADVLARRGWDAELVVAGAHGPLADEAGRAAPVVDLGSGSTVRALVTLARHVRRRQPAVVISTLDLANVVALAATRLGSRDGRAVLRVANMTSVLAATATGADRLVYAVARRAFPAADGLVGPSAATARDLEAWLGLPGGSVHTVPNPVVDDAMLESARHRPAHPWFAEGEPPVVVGMGRLVPHKGFVRLLEAFAAARGETGARLVVLGDGPQREELAQRAAALGVADAVWLAGFDANPYPYLGHCHVFALTSEVEGLPGALIQALACGAKVVAVDGAGGAREVLAGGAHGRLVPADDEDGLREALAEAIRTPPGGPGPAAVERYGAERAGDELEALLEHLLGRGPAATAHPGGGP